MGHGAGSGSADPRGMIVMSAPSVYGAMAISPRSSSESLGSQVMEGLVVEGKVIHQTFPAGATGNDRPFEVTSEFWISSELRVTVLSRTSDPRSGENLTGLSKISRAEPDPRLFQVPRDFQVVDESGPFTIKITGP